MAEEYKHNDDDQQRQNDFVDQLATQLMNLQREMQRERRRHRRLTAAMFSVTWNRSERRRDLVRYLSPNRVVGLAGAELNALNALQQTPIFQQAMTNIPNQDDLSTTQWYQNLEQTYASLLVGELGLTDENDQGQEESKGGT